MNPFHPSGKLARLLNLPLTSLHLNMYNFTDTPGHPDIPIGARAAIFVKYSSNPATPYPLEG
jgi:hypothetical protein